MVGGSPLVIPTLQTMQRGTVLIVVFFSSIISKRILFFKCHFFAIFFKHLKYVSGQYVIVYSSHFMMNALKFLLDIYSVFFTSMLESIDFLISMIFIS